jgi:DNA polymerase III delta prime subunit
MDFNPLWVEKYRPSTIEDTVLPDHIKKTFQSFVDDKLVPNLLLCGGPGVGKTTVARAMLEQLECEYIIINGSLEGRKIDTVRDQISEYASSISMTGRRKYLIVDEADYLNAGSVQPAFRNLMEDLSKNCGFIFTCNYPHKIIEPLQSRFSIIDFKISKEDRKSIAIQLMKRLMFILTEENITFTKDVLAALIMQYFPDWRRIINQLQSYSAGDKLVDSGILNFRNAGGAAPLLGFLKDKDFTSIRKWIAENNDANYDDIFRGLYVDGIEMITKESIANWVSLLGEYQYRLSFVASPEVTVVAMMMQLMMSVTFK